MTDQKKRFAVLGHKGRMGRAIGDAIEEAGHEFCVGVDLGGDPAPLIGQCDVAVDFSAPSALIANVAAARAAGIPILIGTTGLEAEHFAAVEDAAGAIPVLQTGNTSLGITLMAHLVREAAAKLGPDWDIEVLEMHHRGKVDAPSGTAKLLGEAAAHGRDIELAGNREAGRDGNTGPRSPGAIGFAVLRGGTVSGEHSVIFAGDEERLTLAHSAENRMIFARGAVRGARWLIGKAPGRYTMDDVLGLAQGTA
ncbi:MAG: 4-hydroxy-tetrahydrodipicolinate reductase [Pseudomonadota bacterium]